MLGFFRRMFRQTTTTSSANPNKTYRYQFTFPDSTQPVVIRERNQREARALVRETLDLTRLPAGTSVERLD